MTEDNIAEKNDTVSKSALDDWLDDNVDFDIIGEQREKIQIYRAALRKIAKWFGEFPETDEFGDDRTRQLSYLACPRIKRDIEFMRKVARDAAKNV